MALQKKQVKRFLLLSNKVYYVNELKSIVSGPSWPSVFRPFWEPIKNLLFISDQFSLYIYK